jgi:hypothetical protein
MPDAMYHPDPEIDRDIRIEAHQNEVFDLSVGYSPRRWLCDCGAAHRRGWFMSEGVHRCLRCGYVGEGGTMHTNDPSPVTETP